MEPADPRIVEAAAATLGTMPVAWRRVSGGYTQAERWIATLEGGPSAFVKAGLTQETASWLRDEYRIYGAVHAPFLADVLGWHDLAPDAAVLILEDLSAWTWPPPWRPGNVERVLATLDHVRLTSPPQGLPALESYRELLTRWDLVAADPAPFLTLGKCTASWLEASLPVLIDAEKRASLAGTDLLHLDVRSDNVCFSGDRTVLVDWNWACTGNADVDVGAWLCTLPSEGVDMRPWEVLPDKPGIAALLSGYFAYWSGMPPPETADPAVRGLQQRTLDALLEWVVRELDLPPLRRGTIRS